MSRTLRFWLALVAVVLAFAATPARADGPLFPDLEEDPMVPLLADFYKTETIQVITVAQNIRARDDLLVTLFLARLSGRSPVALNEWRKQSMSWEDIMERLKVKPDPLFESMKGVTVPTRYDTYALAARQYAAYKKNPFLGIALYDNTVRALIGLDFMVRKFQMQPLDAMAGREKWGSFVDWASAKVAKKR